MLSSESLYSFQDPPSAPTQPDVVDSGFNFIRLQWKKPEHDGGNPIAGYLVEYKEASSPSSDWLPCNTFPIKLPEYTCSNVLEGLSYEFRVKAVNEAGAGIPSKPSRTQKAEPPISNKTYYRVTHNPIQIDLEHLI